MKNIRKIKRKILARHISVVRGLILLSVLFIIFFFAVSFYYLSRGTLFYKALQAGTGFLFVPQNQMVSFNNRTNILVLGRAGESGNSAPDLTDTIMLVSLKHDRPQEVDLISIPRDIWVGDFQDKVNAMYKVGEERQSGGGLKLSKAIVQEILGLPVHYALVVDFYILKDVVDILGGVTVDVERSFIDNKYPVPGLEESDCGGGDPDFSCRYETVEFTAGKQKMDGETALKFSRSRQSEDIVEGNDFARAKRQQKVFNAIKDKLLSGDTFFSPAKVMRLWSLLVNELEKDMDETQLGIVARRFIQSEDRVESHVLPEDLLFSPEYSAEYNFLYVLLPKNGDWEKVHEWTSAVLR